MLFLGMTTIETFRRLSAQRVYERRVKALGLSALIAPYVVRLATQE